MDIIQSTRAYESWARGQIEIVEADLKLKHAAMAKASFPFLRATFYRWSQVWVEACPDLAAAPGLLAVGDLHVENFGTWRDAEGRLVWGINDFDEAAPMSYAIDLVRLATSALLARDDNGLAIAPAMPAPPSSRGTARSSKAAARPSSSRRSIPSCAPWRWAPSAIRRNSGPRPNPGNSRKPCRSGFAP